MSQPKDELHELAHLSDSDLTASESPAASQRSSAHRRGATAVVAALAAGLLIAICAAVVSSRHGDGISLRRDVAAAVVLASAGGADDADGLKEEAAKGKAKGAASKAEPKKPECKLQYADDKPSLFCWAVMYDSDVDLLTSQFTGRAGIFACNDYSIISKTDVKIGTDDCGNDFHTLAEELPTVKKGMYGVDGAMTSSWLNVPVFTLCWDRLLKEGKVWENDFTVKMDPDAVFFPDRLRSFLTEHKGKPLFTTDCRFWDGDPEGKLFGSIEVLSKEAIGSYKGNADTCKNLPWQGWGEDYWLEECMGAIGVPKVLMADQVSDNTCPMGGGAPCSDGAKVVFHPQKDAGEWWDCWKQSAGPPAETQ